MNYSTSDNLWTVCMAELNRNMSEQMYTYNQIYKIAKHVGPRTPITSILVEYLVGKGYDSDELAELGLRKAIKFIDMLS